MIELSELDGALRARPVDGTVILAGYHTDSTPFFDGSKSDAVDELDEMKDELFDAHELMFAEHWKSVLLVLQGLDCSGKNGGTYQQPTLDLEDIRRRLETPD